MRPRSRGLVTGNFVSFLSKTKNSEAHTIETDFPIEDPTFKKDGGIKFTSK